MTSNRATKCRDGNVNQNADYEISNYERTDEKDVYGTDRYEVHNFKPDDATQICWNDKYSIDDFRSIMCKKYLISNLQSTYCCRQSVDEDRLLGTTSGCPLDRGLSAGLFKLRDMAQLRCRPASR